MLLELLYTYPQHQENMRGQRGSLRALAVIFLVLFLVSESLFSRRPHGLQPRSDVFSEIKKANFNDNGGYVVGTHKHFRGDTGGLCFSWYTSGLCSQVTQRPNKS